MIITLKGADFSGNNIGTLTTWSITRSIGTGATSNQTIKNVVRGAAYSEVITLSDGYTFGTYTVTMGGTTVTPVVEGNTLTINIAAVTGKLVINVGTVNENTGEEILPDVEYFTFEINTTPKVANVTLSAPGYTQSGNSITVPAGTSVSWTVESLGYTTQTGTETITADKSLDVALTAADETQPVLTVYSTPRGKTIWTPTGGKKVNSNETGTFVGDTIGMKCYWGVTKDGYSPWGDVTQLNGNVNKECELEALPMANVDHVLDTTSEMTKVTGYFFSTTTTKGSWNGYYSNFCFFQVPVTSGQKYQITTLTGQNAYPVLFLANAIDLSSYDLSSNPGGNTLTKIDIHSVGKKYAGPPTLGTYQVTVPDGVTAMIVQSQTSTSAMSAFKVELLK